MPRQRRTDVLALAGVIAEDGEVRGVAAARQARLHRIQLPVQPRRCAANVVLDAGFRDYG